MRDKELQSPILRNEPRYRGASALHAATTRTREPLLQGVNGKQFEVGELPPCAMVGTGAREALLASFCVASVSGARRPGRIARCLVASGCTTAFYRRPSATSSLAKDRLHFYNKMSLRGNTMMPVRPRASSVFSIFSALSSRARWRPVFAFSRWRIDRPTSSRIRSTIPVMGRRTK